MNDSDIFRCSPELSSPLSRVRSQSPSSRLLTSRGWQAGSAGRLCRSNPMIRQSLSPSESSCSTGPCLRLTKDPIQPASGSLSDIRGRSHEAPDEEDETFDDFPDEQSRPRAFTCPVTKAFNRKLRLKILNRPPTPTYKDTTTSQGSNFDFQFIDLNEKIETTASSSSSSGERRMSNGPAELEAIIEML